MRQVSELAQRFGIDPTVLDSLGFEHGQGAVFVGTRKVMAFRTVRPLRRGLRLCRIFPRTVKPTTAAMQILGRRAKRNCISVSEEQARQLINGSELEIEADVEDGFVIVRWQEFVIGVGQYRRPRLISCIPRYRPVD
ncbi:MAG: hypothetical protein ABIK86_01265 [candidate division WOR-3 bacterium]